jgi:hypothetical protein
MGLLDDRIKQPLPLRIPQQNLSGDKLKPIEEMPYQS